MRRASVGERRRKIYRLPVHHWADHPEAMRLPASGFGMLARLVLHWWMSECGPLPVSDHELRGIARAHAPMWRHHKPVIMKILSDILPDMELSYLESLKGRKSLLDAGARGRATQRFKAMTKTSHVHTAAEAPVQTAPVKRRQDTVSASVVAATTDTRKLRTDRI